MDKEVGNKAYNGGISLIVLVITIIVMIILASAVVISISKNNPIAEANKARYEMDRDSMQSILTMTVSAIIVENQGDVILTPGQVNSKINGVKDSPGKILYKVENGFDINNSSGEIVFDNGKSSKISYYTGKKLPIYSAGDTIWYCNSKGILTLKVGEKLFGKDGEITEPQIPELEVKPDPETKPEPEVKPNPDSNNLPDNTMVEAFRNNNIKVGDYLNYNDHLLDNNASITIDGSKTGYGVTEQLPKGISQTYKVDKSNVHWRVLGLDETGTKLMLISGTPISKQHAKKQDDDFLHLKGPQGWYHTNSSLVGSKANILNKICKIYDSNLAEEVRSITVEDINRVLGNNKINPKKNVFKYKPGDFSPISYLMDAPLNYKPMPEKGFVRNFAGNQVTETENNYDFDSVINRANNPVLYDMLFKDAGGKLNNKNKNARAYWVANSWFNGTEMLGNYGTVSVCDGTLGVTTGFLDTNANIYEKGMLVFPVVILKPETATNLFKIENNISEPVKNQKYFEEKTYFWMNQGKVKSK